LPSRPVPRCMLTFCPTCATLLLVEEVIGGTGLRFFCNTCAYVYDIDTKIGRELKVDCKEVEDVLGGEEAWDKVDKTEAACPACDSKEAYYMSVQIRSADEPATIFYRCVKCTHRWRQD